MPYRLTGTRDALCLLIILQAASHQILYPGMCEIVNECYSFVRKSSYRFVKLHTDI